MTENEEKNDKLEKTLKDLDWVTVTDAEDPSLFMDMEIMNVTSYKGSWYLLASCEESLSDGRQHGRILLVGADDGLQLLVYVGLRGDDVLHLADCGLIYLRHGGSAEAERHDSYCEVFELFHTFSFFKG